MRLIPLMLRNIRGSVAHLNYRAIRLYHGVILVSASDAGLSSNTILVHYSTSKIVNVIYLILLTLIWWLQDYYCDTSKTCFTSIGMEWQYTDFSWSVNTMIHCSAI